MLYCCYVALLHYCTVALFYCCTVALLKSCTFAQFPCCTVHCYCCTVALLHCYNVSLLHCCMYIEQCKCPVIPPGHSKGVALPWQRALETLCITQAFIVCFQYLQICNLCLRVLKLSFQRLIKSIF